MKANMTLDSSISPSSNILISQFNPLTLRMTNIQFLLIATLSHQT